MAWKSTLVIQGELNPIGGGMEVYINFVIQGELNPI